MTSQQAHIRQVVGKQMEVDGQLRNIFEKHFGTSKPIDPQSDSRENNPGYRAYAGYAVEVGIALANIVISVKKPDSGRGFRAISDLTFALNANEFWIKNAPVLVPVLTIVLNSHRDYVDMATRRKELMDYAVFDKMISASDGASLEIFAMLLYLVGGPELMGTASLPLKMDLAPFLLS
jgi:hypothetical protein